MLLKIAKDTEHTQLYFNIEKQYAVVEYLLGNFTESCARLDRLLGLSALPEDRARILSIKLLVRTNENRYADAIRIGIEALECVGFKIPEKPGMLSLIRALLDAKKLMKGKNIRDLADLKPMSETRVALVCDILQKMIQPCYFSGEHAHKLLMALIIITLHNFTVKYGLSEHAPYILVSYATILGSKLGKYQDAYEYGIVAKEICDRSNDITEKAKTYILFSGMVNHWVRPVDISIELLHQALDAAMKSGLLTMIGNAITQIIYHSVRRSVNLQAIERFYKNHKELLQNTKHEEALYTVECFYRLIRALSGKTDAVSSFSDYAFREDDFVKQISGRKRVLYNYYLTKIEACVFAEEYGDAALLALSIEKDFDDVVVGVVNVFEFYFYLALSLMLHFKTSLKRKHKKIVKRALVLLRKWSRLCDENYGHQYRIASGVWKMLNGGKESGFSLIRRAMTEAEKKGYANHAAIAANLCALYCDEKGDDVASFAYRKRALNYFEEWGAYGLLRASDENAHKTRQEKKTVGKAARASTGISPQLDVYSAIKASQAISSEIMPDKLLVQLMNIVLQNSGAQKASLFMEDAGSFFKEAEARAGESPVLTHKPIEECDDDYIDLVRYVEHTQRPVIIRSKEDAVALLHYFKTARSIRSLLCMPVLWRDKLKALLYLENNLLDHVFDYGRVELFSVILTQAVISLENAKLFARSKAAEAEVNRQYEEMQSQYEELEATTEELEKTHRELMRINENLVIFQRFAASSNQGLGMADLDGKITYVNEAFCKMLGYDSPPSLIGKRTIALYPKSLRKRIAGEVREATFQKGEWVGEVELLHAENAPRIPAIQNIFLIRDNFNEPLCFASIVTDIRSMRAAEAEKEKMRQQLMQAQKMEAVGRLAGGIAHDFNNLLTVIQGISEIMQMGIDESDKNYSNLEHILHACQHASELTRKLLLFSRKEHIKPSTINVTKTLENSLKLICRTISEDITIITNLAPDVKPIFADENSVELSIINLVVNARDAMPSGGTITVTTKNITGNSLANAQTDHKKHGDYVAISVADTGKGIEPEEQSRIFEPFFTTKESGRGTGLGLSVVYGIVNQHGGWIDIDSAPGKGSCFTLYFPAAKSEQTAANETVHTFALYRGEGQHILLVEDQKEVLNVARRILNENGYTVVEATSAEEAIDLFQRHEGNFDLVFSDVVLPKRSGIELVEELQTKKPEIKVLLASGYTDHKSQWPYIQQKGFPFLQKPYAVMELLKKVHELIAK